MASVALASIFAVSVGRELTAWPAKGGTDAAYACGDEGLLGVAASSKMSKLAAWLESVITLCLLNVTGLCEFMALPGTKAAVLV